MIATLVQHGWWLSVQGRARAMRKALQRPKETQRKILKDVLLANANTDFGKEHEFASIATHADYRRLVPLRTDQELRPWIDRIQRGEHNVLTRDVVRRLVPTSGSTDARKLIPYTPSLQRQFNMAIGPWIDDMFRQWPDLARGPAYWSISPSILEDEQSPVPIGFEDDTAYLGGVLGSLLASSLAVPSAVAKIQSIEAFRYATVLCLLRVQGLRFVSVWHPSFFTLLLDTMVRNWSQLVRDVHTGGCTVEDCPEPIRRALRATRSHRRAAHLSKLDPKNVRAIWPRLAVLSCWTDAGAALPTQTLAARLPGIRIQSKGLLATEGFVSIPLRGMRPLAIQSHYFEFLDDAGGVHEAHELEHGGVYEVVLTTAGGLYRYRLGDHVQVDGKLGNTPSISFLGRVNGVSDLVGEKLTEAQVQRAIREWASRFQLSPGFVLLSPESTAGTFGYILYHDLPHTIESSSLDFLDECLCNNPHYRWARKLGQLQPLRQVCAGTGAQERYLQGVAARNVKLGNIKPALLNTSGVNVFDPAMQ